jgi:hypothetical protein
MINYSDDTLRLEEEMRVAVAEWEQSDEFAEFKNMMGNGDTVEYREWVEGKVAEFKEDYRRYV